MNDLEAAELVNKSCRVILSCETIIQLGVAVAYADLVYRQLREGIGLVNNTRFISVTERAIGHTQCKIGMPIKPLPEI